MGFEFPRLHALDSAGRRPSGAFPAAAMLTGGLGPPGVVPVELAGFEGFGWGRGAGFALRGPCRPFRNDGWAGRRRHLAFGVCRDGEQHVA
ncbi:hypothetical protein FAIPA1_90145 [Frankia sp. AiPs1]